jgi:hypothetical protein
MTVLVGCETLLLVLLVVLVAGLLRSHAEILRRLGPEEASSEGRTAAPASAGPVDALSAGAGPVDARSAGAGPVDARSAGAGPVDARSAGARPGRGARPSHDITGLTPAGDAIALGLGATAPPTLIAFLTAGCQTCLRFWQDLQRSGGQLPLPVDLRLVLVAHGVEQESPSRLRELAPDHLPPVMSSQAWRDYRVPAAPYFVLVRDGRVQGEGAATGWGQILALVRDAMEDLAGPRTEGEDEGRAAGGQARTARIDRILAASGIAAGDPSLYPGRQGPEN